MTTEHGEPALSDLLSSSAKPEGMIGTSKQEIDPSPEVKGLEENESSQCQSRIRYRTELRHRVTGDLIHRTDSDKPQQRELENQDNQPIFELITRYETGGSKLEQDREALKEPSAGQNLDSAPSYSLKIYSPAILNALRSVVQYYPSQDLSGSTIEVKWPYPILVHHYDALQQFKANCDAKDPNELCAREKDASAHITELLTFLDKNIMERVRAEEERLEEGFHTFENLWIIFKPGSTAVFRNLHSEWKAMVISHVIGGIYQTLTTPWKVIGWHLEFDGKYLGRRSYEMNIYPFDGEISWKGDKIFIHDRDRIEDNEAESLISYGRMYCDLLMKQCRHHTGRSVIHPYNEIDGLVMADLETFYATTNTRRPTLLQDSDCRKFYSDCTCRICQEKTAAGEGEVKSIFDDYNSILPSEASDLSRHMYLLCPRELPAFVFKWRTWQWLHVKNFSVPEFQNDMIEDLVMDQARVKMLKALAKSYIRVNKRGNPIEHEPWAADFVKGKGNGLIFLLHGKPGVGKTVTAESIAEYTKRPLMIITSSDIGTNPSIVEANLTRSFKLAKSWGAVLLIDEADVFMERRGPADLERNSLVAGFLRALEFYDGILFLTTNRIGAFDDAFISRIHVQLFYPDFTDDERQQVWMTFMQKLTKDRGKFMRISMDAKDYIRGNEVRSVKWNGREIRNAFQTAVSLAEYEDERDEEGKILLTDEHLRSVVELSRDFKEYLSKLHKGDEEKRALRRYERLDT
ncbi:Protein MSP1 [Diaporthe eres]|nr:Protein MSP1 [Diaporthe eres]